MRRMTCSREFSLQKLPATAKYIRDARCSLSLLANCVAAHQAGGQADVFGNGVVGRDACGVPGASSKPERRERDHGCNRQRKQPRLDPRLHGRPRRPRRDGQCRKRSERRARVVNASTGNLVLRDQDDVLAARASMPPTFAPTTASASKTTTTATTGRTALRTADPPGRRRATRRQRVVRTERDGAEANYTYDAGRGLYSSSPGGGADDSVAYDAAAVAVRLERRRHRRARALRLRATGSLLTSQGHAAATR